MAAGPRAINLAWTWDTRRRPPRTRSTFPPQWLPGRQDLALVPRVSGAGGGRLSPALPPGRLDAVLSVHSLSTSIQLLFSFLGFWVLNTPLHTLVCKLLLVCRCGGSCPCRQGVWVCFSDLAALHHPPPLGRPPPSDRHSDGFHLLITAANAVHPPWPRPGWFPSLSTAWATLLSPTCVAPWARRRQVSPPACGRGRDTCPLRPTQSLFSTNSSFLTVKFQPVAFLFQKCSALLH